MNYINHPGLITHDRATSSLVSPANEPFSIGSVAGETIDIILAAEQREEIATLLDRRFGSGTWQSILDERAKRLKQLNERKRKERQRKEKQREDLTIAASIAFAMLAALGVFALLYMKFI